MDEDKLVVFSSEADKAIYNNTSTIFTNTINPIQKNISWDYVQPLMVSIPLTTSIMWRVNKKYLDELKQVDQTSINIMHIDGTAEISDKEQYVQIRLSGYLHVIFFPDVNFLEKVDNTDMFVDINFYFDLLDINNQSIDHILFKGYAGFDLIVGTFVKDNDELSIKAAKLNLDNLQNIILEGKFFRGTMSFVLNQFYIPKDFSSVDFHWSFSEDKKKYVEELWKDYSNLKNNFYFYSIQENGIHSFVPPDFWVNTADLDEDNQQVYIHCDKIRPDRIANQSEPIFQDLFFDTDKIKDSRLTDYLSVEMAVPLKLTSSYIDSIKFEFLNGLGEENSLIDKDRETIIICKFIKSYYDFSDGKKKIKPTLFLQ